MLSSPFQTNSLYTVSEKVTDLYSTESNYCSLKVFNHVIIGIKYQV